MPCWLGRKKFSDEPARFFCPVGRKTGLFEPQNGYFRISRRKIHYFDPMRYLRNLQNKGCMRKYVIYKTPAP